MRNMSLQQATALPRNMSLQQTHVARVGVEALASQKKKSMFNRAWLSAGDVGFVNAKLDGFKDVDSVTYQLLVGEFVESFDVHVQRLHKVETKSDVAEVHQLVLQLPRFAKILDGELSHAKILDCELSHLSKCWDDIWGSFLESVEKKWRLANSMSLGQEQQDITECVWFLRAARKILKEVPNSVSDAEDHELCFLPLPCGDGHGKRLWTRWTVCLDTSISMLLRSMPDGSNTSYIIHHTSLVLTAQRNQRI